MKRIIKFWAGAHLADAQTMSTDDRIEHAVHYRKRSEYYRLLALRNFKRRHKYSKFRDEIRWQCMTAQASKVFADIYTDSLPAVVTN